jgi:rRNA maturation RNase YbeY
MIKYFAEDIDFNYKGKAANNRWLRFVASSELKKTGDINIIFCSDSYLLDINLKYLGHDYFTDIITFDYCEGNLLSGDLFISIDSVRENASFYKVEFIDELRRVMVHGLLHLIGYDDKSVEEQKTMRAKEDYYLSLRESVTGEN